MKVLLANNYFYLRGGCERVMFNDFRALVARGIEVVPFSASDPANEPSDYSAFFARGVDVHATNPFRRLQAAREAIHCTRTAKAFAAILDQTRPDIVHCHNIYGRLTTSILTELRRANLPAVLTVHDYKIVCPSYLMLRNQAPCTACLDGAYYRCAVHRCHKQNLAGSIVYAIEAYHARASDSYGAISAFLCPSRFVADLLVRSGIEPKRVIYHPNSVNAHEYTPQYDGDYVFYAGRLSHEKGLPTLVQSMLGTGIPLRIAGTGPLEEELKALAASASNTNILFEGHCNGQRLADLYRNAALVVLPSEWYENAPMTILEAFAYGKPVIASSIGGIPEMVVSGENGYLVECGDRDELRAAVSRLWNDGAARVRMGRSARRIVETTYSDEQRMISLLGIYDTIGTSMSRSISRQGSLADLMAHS